MCTNSTKEFTKYSQRGAYHWKWYETNKYSYRDYAHQVISYLEKNGTILDIGCGDGVTAYLLFQKGFDVTGIDADEVGIKLGNQEIVHRYAENHKREALLSVFNGGMKKYLHRKGIRLYQESINNLSSSNSFDYAICQEVIEHVPDPERLVAKVLDVVRYFTIFTTPNGNYNIPQEHDYFMWKPDDFIDLLGRDRAELLSVDENRIFARLWGQDAKEC